MSLRLFWRRFHLWIGVATGLFLLGISLSGIVLMFDDAVNKLTRPELYAVSGPAMAQSPDVYFAKARESVPNGDPYQLRYPEETGFPVVVMMRLKDARGAERGAGGSVGEGGRGEGGRGERANRDMAAANADAASADPAEHRDGEHRGNGERGNGERHDGERRGSENGTGGGYGAGTGGGNMGAPGGNMGAGGMGAGARPRTLAVYLDPPTAKVLGSADPRASVAGWALALHANLFLQPYGGRQIVGWIGLGLFILCASGLYLWWPRGGSFLRGLRWTRGPTVSVNLHHRVGVWIVLPLGVMAFTGFIQGFPQQSRAVTGALMPISAQQQRSGNGSVTPNLSLQRVQDLAMGEGADFHPTMLALPQEAGKPWRVMLENAAGDKKTLLIDDATETLSSPPAPLQGDNVLGFLRRIHEGHHDGPIWETIVLLTALTPTLFFVTGVMMWLRRRKNEKAVALRSKAAQSGPALPAAAE